MVGLHGIEYVAHSCRGTFGGEKVIDGLVVASAHSPAHVVAHNYLGVFEDSGRCGVMVAQNAVDPFKHQFVGIRIVGRHHVVVDMIQYMSARTALVVDKEGLESVGHTLLGRALGDAERRVVFHAVGLADRKLAQKEECLAGEGQHPVGIATAGVEECCCRAACVEFGEINQSVLDFKRAHGRQSFFKRLVFVFTEVIAFVRCLFGCSVHYELLVISGR